MAAESDPKGVRLDYFIVDVFSESALAGNPLAVVMDTAGLATETMQAIAREFNLSETTFVQRREAAVEQAEGVRVRIFTTEEELQFAGHPTLGTASVLKVTAPETVREGVVTLRENVGPIPVRFDGEGLFGEMTQGDPEFGIELDAGEVAGLCGLEAKDLDGAHAPQVVSTGAAFAVVMLRSVEALGRLRVRQQEATAWLRDRGARWFYVLAPDDARDENGTKSFCARMQFHSGEDPATGSGAGCAIAYMVRRNIVLSDERIHVRQGLEIHRPSDLYLTARERGGKVREVRVAGCTVAVARGELFLP
jgi:trans-2,3-dihydro-3-hydroxyanthranilate isomerase